MKSKTNIKATFVAALLISSATLSMNVFSQEEKNLSYKTEKVSDTIYMLSGVGGFTGGNVGLSIGSDGVALIDNGLSSVIDILKAEIATLTDKPVDYMINTHIHGDHIGNNHVFGNDGAQIVSHENLRVSLIQDEKNSGPAALPVLTFNDRMTIHLNGDAAQIIHFDNAHTDGDAVVYFKNDNVLHTGDIMFHKVFPFIDGNNGGSLDGVIHALESIAALVDDETKIIPGHGPLANRADVIATLTMITQAKASVGKLVSQGMTDDEIIEAKPLAPFEAYSWGFITTEKMTRQVLAGLKK
jgi:glyoxylase-like metal-dependent hydrolase (beta-lactamase superfamily II)